MGRWSGKYVIGLTGNIGTGKSVVRRMLEHLGAYGIDADALAHRAIAKGAPGYQPILDAFGSYIVGPDGQIDRGRLGKIVFSDPSALNQLESIVHPLVRQAVDVLVHRSPHRVVVIEAIKLLESDIGKNCDAIWVTYAPPEIQVARLIQNRGMSESDARQRINAQPPQEQKLRAASVVIQNIRTMADTWKQVAVAWQKNVPQQAQGAPAASGQAASPAATPGAKTAAPAANAAVARPQPGPLTVVRGKPRHSAQIAELINRVHHPLRPVDSDDIMSAFGDRAFLLLESGQRLMGAIGWQVENLVSRAVDVILDPILPPTEGLSMMIREMERSSQDLQCEASLIFVPHELARQEALWKNLGYEQRTPQSLGVLAWQEAAIESMPQGTTLFFKQLRVDRILRPI